jgi:hypothetical protein
MKRKNMIFLSLGVIMLIIVAILIVMPKNLNAGMWGHFVYDSSGNPWCCVFPGGYDCYCENCELMQ